MRNGVKTDSPEAPQLLRGSPKSGTLGQSPIYQHLQLEAEEVVGCGASKGGGLGRAGIIGGVGLLLVLAVLLRLLLLLNGYWG